MIIHKGYENLHLINPVVTLGIFDGVHRGHKSLLNCLEARAKEVMGEAVVITFFPHPRIVLEKSNTNLTFLSTMDEKITLLEKANVDHLIIIDFNIKFSGISACDFVKEILLKKIGTNHLIIGYNHHFGNSGKGDYITIKQCTEDLNFRVEQVQGYHTEEGAISSSSIREALLKGKLDEANKWLGYRYSLRGIVVEGHKIGRAIGFPTANIKPDDHNKLIPGDGVYAVEVLLEGLIYKGMMSIGSNPTVNKHSENRSIEVHILDFDSDIYGKNLTVIFHKRLRDEITFSNTDQLTDQMKLDQQQVLELLS